MTLGFTVEQMIRHVLPKGTTFEVNVETKWDQPPDYPPDLYAVIGHILQNSGIYQYVISAENHSTRSFPDKSILITSKDRERIEETGSKWAIGATPKRVKTLWSVLSSCSKPLLVSNGGASERWWSAAVELLAIADEACNGVGYFVPENENRKENWVAKTANAILENGIPRTPSSRHVKHHDDRICSIASTLVNSDVVCVQPKSRTPNVGCSLRNLSKNLSLLPPRGQMKIHWLTPPVEQPSEHQSNLNLLLIPYPYKIENTWIKTEIICNENEDGWGWFELQQEWLQRHEDKFLEFIDALISKAATTNRKINGLVFPEFSLIYKIYEKLAIHLRDKYMSFDFLVAGTSENCNEKTGNFALASHFYKVAGGNRAMATVSRPKHHRWSLDRKQIESYKLNSSFQSTRVDLARKPECFKWWEHIPIYQRRIHVNALRDSSVFTAMICEDLARSDPAHEPIKAVGPNIVFVLLMDGPQIEWRWAARYSTGLAEDPGSSVMTITSKALVERWNAGKKVKEKNWSIGIWKDSKNRAKEIICSPDSQAVVVELTSDTQIERTIDGRKSLDSFCWTIASDPVEVRLGKELDDLITLFCN